ncbi:hypothetical protein QE440_004045 [Pseudomonas psychrotolerans]|uniref:Uncharacterized protein n=2 Tax=Pseudomonas oryzihabitans TaxID=47885 RepID=A0AAJ2BTS0_9PSED|nr:hypothetical protein [Pseudomonas psychrotolerans]
MQSTAAYIGAVALREAAQRLTHRIRLAQPIREDVSTLQFEVERCLATLDEVLASSPRLTQDAAPEKLETQLEQLVGLLQTSDFAAEALLDRLMDAGGSIPHSADLVRIREWVDDVEFEHAADAALDLLRRVRQAGQRSG